MKQRRGKMRDIEIRDSGTGESLAAHLDSIILSRNNRGEVTAMMVARFPSSSYETLLKWLELLRAQK